MTGLASRKITAAALVTGTLAVGLLAPTAAGALAPGHGTSTTTAAPVTAATTTAAPTTTAAAAHAAVPATARTTAYANGKVEPTVPLRIRSRATTNSTALGSLAPGAVVKLSCKVYGQNVGGNDLWYDLYSRPGWVAARFVKNLGAVPFC